MTNASLRMWNQPSWALYPVLASHPLTPASLGLTRTPVTPGSHRPGLLSAGVPGLYIQLQCASEACKHASGLGYRGMPVWGPGRAWAWAPRGLGHHAEPTRVALLTACTAAGSSLPWGKRMLTGGHVQCWPMRVATDDGGFAHMWMPCVWAFNMWDCLLGPSWKGISATPPGLLEGGLASSWPGLQLTAWTVLGGGQTEGQVPGDPTATPIEASARDSQLDPKWRSRKLLQRGATSGGLPRLRTALEPPSANVTGRAGHPAPGIQGLGEWGEIWGLGSVNWERKALQPAWSWQSVTRQKAAVWVPLCKKQHLLRCLPKHPIASMVQWLHAS